MGFVTGSAGIELSIIAVVLSIVLYAIHWLKSRRTNRLLSKLPGPKGLPLIGNLFDLTGGPNAVFQRLVKLSESENNKDIMKMVAGPRVLVFIWHPADVELILGSHIHLDKAPEYKFFEPWLGNGLLISTGEKWRSHRKLIAPTFHINILKSFFDTFNKNAKGVVDRLKELSGKSFDCHDYMSEATVEILLETVMGVNKKNQENAFEYAMAVMKMCDILHLRQTKVWLRPQVVFNMTSYSGMQKSLLSTIHKLTRKVLRIRKTAYEMGLNPKEEEESKEPTSKTIEQLSPEDNKDKSYSFGQSAGLKDDLDDNDNDIGQKKRLAFLDLLIQGSQNGGLLSDDEIQNQVDTIMFEGHDTTAAASSFFLCAMAAYPEIQEKVIEEIDEIFQGSDRSVTFQDTTEMKYLERCIMEAMRMYPPVPAIARELKEDVRLKSREDLIIPAGTTVVVATYKLHRRPDIYPNPEVFNPDNFLPENSANRHYYSYIPFSAGPRSCVGRKYAMLKLKVLLATIMRSFRVVGGPKEKDWLLQADIILKRTDGFNVVIQPRKPIVT